MGFDYNKLREVCETINVFVWTTSREHKREFGDGISIEV
jgi:hypothetical protein